VPWPLSEATPALFFFQPLNLVIFFLFPLRPWMFGNDCVLRVRIPLPRWLPARPPLPLRRLYLRAGDFHSAGRRGWR